MFIQSRHDELRTLIAKIDRAIDLAEAYREDLADPENRERWHEIWMLIDAALEYLFEEELGAMSSQEALNWLAIAHAYGAAFPITRVMIDECRSDRAHRRANLGALTDITLILALHKAYYERASREPPSSTDTPPRSNETAGSIGSLRP